jgi:hypothetical protein
LRKWKKNQGTQITIGVMIKSPLSHFKNQPSTNPEPIAIPNKDIIILKGITNNNLLMVGFNALFNFILYFFYNSFQIFQ